MGKHKVHRTPTWKRDAFLLSCILRLRVEPPIPFHTIASLLTISFPDIAHKLAHKEAPRDLRAGLAGDDAKLQDWLEVYLEERHGLAEHFCSKQWEVARTLGEDVVQEIVKAVGINDVVEMEVDKNETEEGLSDSEKVLLGGVEKCFVSMEQRPLVQDPWPDSKWPDISVGELESLWNDTMRRHGGAVIAWDQSIRKTARKQQTSLLDKNDSSRTNKDINTSPQTRLMPTKMHDQNIDEIADQVPSIRVDAYRKAAELHHRCKKTRKEKPQKLANLPRIWTRLDQELEDVESLHSLHERYRMEEVTKLDILVEERQTLTDAAICAVD